MDKKRTVENVSIDGDDIIVSIRLPKSEMLNEASGFDYNVKDIIHDTIREIARTYLNEHKKEIMDSVLKDVNWSELVRSDIAKKIIAEAARGY